MLLLDKHYHRNMKSSYLWLLDAGHSGLDKNGKYLTGTAKMHSFPNGTVIYEGVINRAIAKLLYVKLEKADIDFALVYDDIEDTPLHERVSIADNVYRKDKRSVYLSIHSNAGGGSGFEIFTSPGQTKSDKVANIFCETYMKHFPDYPFRSDKSDADADKEENFYVLRKTDCPSLLVENLFFDNLKEAEFLLSTQGQESIAECLFQSILNCEKLQPI